jgi:hypothetical protein
LAAKALSRKGSWWEKKVKRIILGAALAALATPGAAQASELFAGIYAHDVKTPLNLSGVEDGADVMVGWRGGRIGRTPLQPYVYGALHTGGRSHYAAAGLSARFGNRFYVRPGFGVAVHSGSASNVEKLGNGRIEYGSRILFAPEIAVGAQINQRFSVEASLIHLSHGQLFGRQNPGTDHLGVRLNLAL